MLEELLTVKRRREDDAIAALAQARRALEQQQSLLEAKRRELEEYKAWRREEAERLFEAVRKQEVSRAKLERYRQEVALLQQREAQLGEELIAAERDVEAAKSNVAQAERQRMDAHKAVVKFEEYQKQVFEDEATEASRREEAELEDVTTGRRG
ncbi:MAG: YscO family type III secretion system apparatus protein [Gammaproteobacteria bacterium]|nr:YscO family type III secretion system apparatus protein [Gammaproteobacteria bacterium]MDE0273951.1 YscO family type III secretion system apparatus protein [Gammaproteobacteria bacterium]